MKKEDYEEFQRQLDLQNQVGQSTQKTKKDDDGTEYEWDEVKKAWFPKLSEDLLLQYQSNYQSAELKKSNEKKKQDSYYDPNTKTTFNWDAEKGEWVVATPVASSNPYEYRDPTTGVLYYWSTNENKWIMHDATSTSYTDPGTGKTYQWDKEKYLWVSEDGSTLEPAASTSAETALEQKDSEKINKKRKMTTPKSIGGKKSKAEWFDVDKNKNTSVYVSGLPTEDFTLEEFTQMMQKYGIIQTNPITDQLKVKLYRDSSGHLKGDGLCSYLKRESLELVMNLLHDTEVRRNHKVKIQEAKFELKGSYDPFKKPKMLSKQEKKKLQKKLDKKLDWKLGSAETEKVSRTDRVVIFKNMFVTKDFDDNPLLITEIRDDLRRECEKFGDVKKVILFDRHTDGICSVAFKEIDSSIKCIAALNKRWFGGKLIEAFTWDGVTNYEIEETEKEREERLKNWDQFLTEDEQKEKDNKDKADANEASSS